MVIAEVVREAAAHMTVSKNVLVLGSNEAKHLILSAIGLVGWGRWPKRQ